MIVKLVRKTGETKLFETTNVNVLEDDTGQFIVDIAGHEAQTCTKSADTLYVMNDQGKTVDTYRFA